VAQDDLLEMITALTPEECAAVQEFIVFLKHKPDESSFLRAVDEFIGSHPELLRRLAQ